MEDTLAFKRLHNVRWLARDQAITAAKRNLRPLLDYLHGKKEDPVCMALYNKVRDFRFLGGLYFFSEIHGRLAGLSKAFQRDDIKSYQVNGHLETFYLELELEMDRVNKLKTSTVLGMDEFVELKNNVLGIEVPYFFGHEILFQEESLDSINAFGILVMEPFVNELLANMKRRFPSLGVMNAFSIFDITIFPKERKYLSEYGEEEFEVLLEFYGIEKSLLDGTVFAPIVDKEATRREWRKLKAHIFTSYHNVSNELVWKMVFDSDKERTIYPNILKLVSIYLLIPMSTAIVERGFSIMNCVVLTKLRNRLEVERANSLMCVSINGPEPFIYTPSRGRARGVPSLNPQVVALLAEAKEAWSKGARRQLYTRPDAIRSSNLS